MKNTFKIVTIFFAVALVLFASERVYHRFTDGFMLWKIVSHRAADPRWEVQPLAREEQRQLASALAQEYSYLGKGKQAFAFVSADGQYVLKFLKQYRQREMPYLEKMALPSLLQRWKEQKIGSHRKRYERNYRSALLAYQTLREETGLLYIHLNPSKDLQSQIRLKDKLGRVYVVEADAMVFILQKRAELLKDRLSRLERTGDIEGVRKSFLQLRHLLIKRFQKGIRDEEVGFKFCENYGFVDNHAISVDCGRFCVEPCLCDSHLWPGEVHRMTEDFEGWLSERYPNFLPLFLEEVDIKTK